MKFNNFIKRGAFALLVILVGTCCSASQVKKEKTPSQNKTTTESTSTGNISQKDLAYHHNTDAQPDLGDYTNYAFTKNGYYHMKFLNTNDNKELYQLTFTDRKSGKTVPVCTKSNCTHKTEDCDANFDGDFDQDHASAHKNYYIGVTYFQYYKGAIYLPVRKGDYVYIMKVSADGSTRSNVMKLCRFLQVTKKKGDATEVASYYPMMQIHRGYVYFTNDETGGKTATLYRKKIGGSKIETILHLKSSEPMIYRIHPYGNYVFYIAGEMDHQGNMKSNLYAYNTKTKKRTLQCKNLSGNYTVYKGSIYYLSTGKNIRLYRLPLGGKKSITITKLPSLSQGENINVFSANKKVVVQYVNSSGNYGQQIVVKNDKKVAAYDSFKIKPYQNE